MKTLQSLSKKQMGYLEGTTSIIVNTALFGVKIWIGAMLGSISMIADAWHTLSDTLTSIVVIVGFMISSKPADDAHPYGHGRFESIAATIIGTLLAVVGFSFLFESIQRLIYFKATQFNLLGIIIFLVSAFLKEALAQFSFFLGQKANSLTLTADGWHHRSDAIASGLIVVGALLGNILWWIDGVMGIAVSLLILWAAFEIILENTNLMIGERLTPEIQEKITSLVSAISAQISDIHHFHLHRYGDHVELTFHIRVTPNMPVQESHEIVNKIEEKLRKELQYHTTVHVEPDNEVNIN
jgi:cation diffusion facilitator family transporter